MAEQRFSRGPGVRMAAALVGSVVLLSVPGWARGAVGAAETAADLTFRGQASGGIISITTTADRTGIVRAEADEIEFQVLSPTGPVMEPTFSKTLYLEPPLPITDGNFEFGLPGSLAGMVRASLRVEGAFSSDTRAAGTATYVYCTVSGCSASPPRSMRRAGRSRQASRHQSAAAILVSSRWAA